MAPSPVCVEVVSIHLSISFILVYDQIYNFCTQINAMEIKIEYLNCGFSFVGYGGDDCLLKLPEKLKNQEESATGFTFVSYF